MDGRGGIAEEVIPPPMNHQPGKLERQEAVWIS